MNQVERCKQFPGGQQLVLVRGDITAETVDAIVNAANEYLMHGGGVAAAIVRKGGQVIQDESDHWVREKGPVSHAEPAYTSAGNLPCKHVIHAVGPVWGMDRADERLATAIFASLRTAENLGLSSLALPALSTGTFRFPAARAAVIILDSIEEFFERNPQTHLEWVRLVVWDEKTSLSFRQTWDTRYLSVQASDQ